VESLVLIVVIARLDLFLNGSVHRPPDGSCLPGHDVTSRQDPRPWIPEHLSPADAPRTPRAAWTNAPAADIAVRWIADGIDARSAVTERSRSFGDDGVISRRRTSDAPLPRRWTKRRTSCAFDTADATTSGAACVISSSVPSAIRSKPTYAATVILETRFVTWSAVCGQEDAEAQQDGSQVRLDAVSAAGSEEATDGNMTVGWCAGISTARRDDRHAAGRSGAGVG
jgi:hypothetical protein